MTTTRSRGQVLVLACLSMIMVALMLMLSFNVTNAIHEKIRIQAVADSQALSTATLEARALNTMAFMNRSIAGAMVAGMALHAWWTIAENEVGMLKAGQEAFGKVATEEYGKCPPHNYVHCADGAQASLIATRYGSKASSYQSSLRGLDGRFREAVQALSDMMKDLHVDQKRVLDNTRNEIASTSRTLAAIKQVSAPHASYVSAIDSLNLSELACALEGSRFDDRCQSQSWKPAARVLSASSRGAIMESAAMAARPQFQMGNAYWRSFAHSDFKGGGVGDGPLPRISMPVTISDPREPKNIQSEGTYTLEGTGLPRTWARNDKIGAEMSPGSTGKVSVTWRHGHGFGFASGSGASPQGQRESNSPYAGLPCGNDNCFINFRANTSASADYGQPATYGALTQDLRLQLSGRRGPWELNQRGTLDFAYERGRPARLVLVPQGNAYAVAKGKTYFHQLGSNGWQTPPNMFDPFWRAKLQSFQRDELKSVLQRIGDLQGANIIAGGGAVEGKVR